jgi:hypothetical protein
MWNDVRQAKGLRKKWFYIFGDPIAIAKEKEKQAQATLVPMITEDSKSA